MVSEFEVINELESMTEIPDADKELCLDMCRVSLERVRQKLKSTADYSDPRVLYAAAALAMYFYTLRVNLNGSGDYSYFKAGDITVSQNSSQRNSKITQAKELYLAAERELAPLMEDRGFYVGKVDI